MGSWKRKSYNEKVGNRYSQSNIMWVAKSRRLSGTGHVGVE
jgi:hypothetical protein